jgi:phage terminase large subunit
LHNGAVLEFKSYDNEQDSKNGKRQFLFLNEANGVSYEIYKQLQIRTSIQTFIDYNPTSAFWVHSKLLGRADAVRFISNYADNGYINERGEFVSNLPQSIIENIEEYRNDPDDAEMWRVYGLGLTGKVSGVVYPNITWVSKMPPVEDCKQTVFGLDWGYSNDPSVFCRVSLYQGQLYAEGLLYERGLQYCKTSSDQKDGIAELLNRLPYELSRFEIVADNDRRGIDALKDFRIYCTPANKYAGSVVEGIQAVKKFKLNIVNNPDWKKEQLKYIYKKNRQTGEPDGNNPKKGNDHYFDALRYAVQKIHFRKGGSILATSYKK